MVQELAHRVDSSPAGRTASDHYTAPTIRNRWRLIYEVRKIVSVNFFLDCGEQNGFLHERLRSSMCRGRERQYKPESASQVRM
jgi:hypothetical protein